MISHKACLRKEIKQYGFQVRMPRGQRTTSHRLRLTVNAIETLGFHFVSRSRDGVVARQSDLGLLRRCEWAEGVELVEDELQHLGAAIQRRPSEPLHFSFFCEGDDLCREPKKKKYTTAFFFKTKKNKMSDGRCHK